MSEDVCPDCKRENCWGGSVCIKIKGEKDNYSEVTFHPKVSDGDS